MLSMAGSFRPTGRAFRPSFSISPQSVQILESLEQKLKEMIVDLTETPQGQGGGTGGEQYPAVPDPT